jgi:hypothetical protein
MPLSANLVNSRPTGRYKFYTSFGGSSGLTTLAANQYSRTLGPLELGTEKAHLIVYATVSVDDGATTQGTVNIDPPTFRYGATVFETSWKTFEYTVNEQDNFDAKAVRIMGWNVPALPAGSSKVTFEELTVIDDATGWIILIFIDNDPSQDSIDNRIVTGTMVQEGVASGMPAFTETLTTHQVGLWTYGRANARDPIYTTANIRPGNEGSANFVFTNLPTRASYYISICFHLTSQNQATGTALFHHHRLSKDPLFAPTGNGGGDPYLLSNGNVVWAGNDNETDHIPGIAAVGQSASARIPRSEFQNSYYTSIAIETLSMDGVEICYAIMEARKVPFDASLYLKVPGSIQDENGTLYGFASLLVI